MNACLRGVAELRIVCTDRGQHRKHALARILVGPGLTDFLTASDNDLSESDKSFRAAGRMTYLGEVPEYDEFRCVGCGRNPRIDHETLVGLLRELCRLGRTELDVSALPF